MPKSSAIWAQVYLSEGTLLVDQHSVVDNAEQAPPLRGPLCTMRGLRACWKCEEQSADDLIEIWSAGTR